MEYLDENGGKFLFSKAKEFSTWQSLLRGRNSLFRHNNTETVLHMIRSPPVNSISFFNLCLSHFLKFIFIGVCLLYDIHSFLLYRKVNQLYVYIYPLIFLDVHLYLCLEKWNESGSESCSVVSRSHLPRELYSSGGSPGQNTGVGSHFSRGSSWPRNRARVSCTAGGFFTNGAIGEAQEMEYFLPPR